MNISIAEVERRIQVFKKVLPGNPADNADWSTLEISRVFLKHAPQRTFNPAIETDKHDIQHYLRRQFYNDITVEARAKAAQLRRDKALQKLRVQ